MNCILKVNDKDNQIGKIFEATGDGLCRYFVNTNTREPEATVTFVQSIAGDYVRVQVTHSTLEGRTVSLIDLDLEEPCEVQVISGWYEVIIICIAKRLIEKQEEVYPNENRI